MKEEFKNWLFYKQYVKDEDLSIWPYVILLALVVMGIIILN